MMGCVMAYLSIFLLVSFLVLFAAALLNLLGRMGGVGTKIVDALCIAPWLDALVFYWVVMPWILGGWLLSWGGIFTAVLAQVTSLLIWIYCHEKAHPQHQGHKIYRTLDKIVGRKNNIIALWATIFAVPVFVAIRIAEYVLYPVLNKSIGLPYYKHSDWISVSRHKFDGLVGYDLIWCLYCDWMTGVWALGSENLRNVESFWCPIRFADDKKCENCVVDFPDIDGGWVGADSNMIEVTQLLEEKFKPEDKEMPWYGHPDRKEKDTPPKS